MNICNQIALTLVLVSNDTTKMLIVPVSILPFVIDCAKISCLVSFFICQQVVCFLFVCGNLLQRKVRLLNFFLKNKYCSQ